MQSFLFGGVALLAIMVTTNVLAESTAGDYVCEATAKEYISCDTGKYFDGTTCATCYTHSDVKLGSGISYEYLSDDDSRVLWPCTIMITQADITNGEIQHPLYCTWARSDGIQIEGVQYDTGVPFCYEILNEALDRSEGAIKCDSGYVLDGWAPEYDTSVMPNIYNDHTVYNGILIIRDASQPLACVKVPAGSYYDYATNRGLDMTGPDFAYSATLCNDFTEADGIARGQYCPEGSVSPSLCPQANNTLDGAVVYGLTGTQKADIADCYLPAGDTVYVEEGVGMYKLVDTCGFVKTSN